MAILRLFMLLSVVVWLGGLIFFAFVLAPTVFNVLPTRHLAGSVVNRSLTALHWMGIVSGVVFLVSSMVYTYLHDGAAQPLAARHVLVYLMLLLTLVSQLAVSPKMTALRADMVQIDDVPATDPRRVEFNRLHVWSTRLEQGVFFLGLGLVVLVARRLS